MISQLQYPKKLYKNKKLYCKKLLDNIKIEEVKMGYNTNYKLLEAILLG